MFFLFATILVVSALFFWQGQILQRKGGGGYINDKGFGRCVACGILFGLALLWLVFAGGSVILDQSKDLTTIEGLHANTQVLRSQRVKVENDIRAQLDKYPEIEKSIIKDIDPQILFQYPQLKSNETITSAFNSLNDMNAKMADNEREIAKVKAQVKMREFAPMNTRVPGLFIYYQDYFNEPISQR